jgi:hypothetical protein
MATMDFTEDWYGWRLRGRHLVSPDGQRMTRRRLEGLLWRDEMELRLAGFASRRNAEEERPKRQLVKVIVVELAQMRVHGEAAS